MKLKGLGLKNTLTALERLHGKDGLERVRAVMPGADPRRLLADPAHRVVPRRGRPPPSTSPSATRSGKAPGKRASASRGRRAKIELHGVYRILLRAVQYDTVWDRMERMWPQYYDAGEARWVDRGRGHATAQFRGVAGFNEGMWGSVAGRIEILLEMTGARGAAVTVKDPASTRATIEALWLE